MPYERRERYAGATKYPLRKMLALAADGVTSFSDAPLRIAGGLGMALFMLGGLGLGLVAALYALGVTSELAALATGLAALATGLDALATALTGLQLTFIGALGAYVASASDDARSTWWPR